MRCSKEADAVGPYGPVEDGERLYRAAFSPQHFRKNGALKPSILPPSHIARSGLSLVRNDKLSDAELVEICSAIAEAHSDREWFGGFQFTCLCVREIRDEEGRLVCVLDDPAPEANGVPANDAHSIAISHDGDMSDEDAMEVRAHILEHGEFVPKET